MFAKLEGKEGKGGEVTKLEGGGGKRLQLPKGFPLIWRGASKEMEKSLKSKSLTWTNEKNKSYHLNFKPNS